jgi:hypothetical protein
LDTLRADNVRLPSRIIPPPAALKVSRATVYRVLGSET